MKPRPPHPFTLTVVLLAAFVPPAPAQEVRVHEAAALRQAIAGARPGARILIAPGDYPGGMFFEGPRGAPGRPIVIAAADARRPPRIVGGASAFHFTDPAYLELRHLVLIGASGNGLNIDDGGSFDTPAHHLLLSRLRVQDVGPHGNRDGIKLSGVDDFRVEHCVVESWGDGGGSAIDMVGCHRGIIEGCRFRQGEGRDGTGVQAKGGSTAIQIRRNRFEHAGARAVNLGGSTGLAYFRPRPGGYEARDLRVEGNLFIGSTAPIAFVGVDGAQVRFNTLWRPGRWALRILQETREPGFASCRNGVFSDNIIVFRSDRWAEGGVNIGPGTAPETFRFARNLWYCEDRPELSQPRLPTAETGGVTGRDPLFQAPASGDFRLRPGSPASGRGHTALPTVNDEP